MSGWRREREGERDYLDLSLASCAHVVEWPGICGKRRRRRSCFVCVFDVGIGICICILGFERERERERLVILPVHDVLLCSFSSEVITYL